MQSDWKSLIGSPNFFALQPSGAPPAVDDDFLALIFDASNLGAIRG